jgi:hypothetical protein
MSEFRIEEARRLLNNELFVEGIQGLKDQLQHEWSVTDAHDIDGREQIWLELKLVDRLVGHLTSIFEEGQITKFTSNLKDL